MTSVNGHPSSPAPNGSSLEEELAYYKAQYEQLEVELQEFQASSRELEAELEKDVEASEKRERQLKEKVEGLGFEVEEWKTKYRQSKAESAAAQNALEKEITTLRDTNRTLQLRLRDIEVANDDFERQARNTTSSLEDLESKYNVAIERGVMLEEEIRVGEQERETLRIETQRLRDELSDHKIEAEIVLQKLRLAEATTSRQLERKTQGLAAVATRPRSPASETSASVTTPSSPAPSTPPPAKSETSTTYEAPTPPSPPLSETSANSKLNPVTPVTAKPKPPAEDTNTTPRPGHFSARAPRHSRGPSIPLPSASRGTPSLPRRVPTTTSRPSIGPSANSEMPRSGSLYQIRGLIGKMQKLEARVQSARSKLPAPTATPPHGSPRNGSAMGNHTNIPATVTVRSSRKRASAAGSATSSVYNHDNGAAGNSSGRPPTPSHSVSRLSFGGITGGNERQTPLSSRPSSRTSAASHSAATQFARPSSRQSVTGARTPLGHYPSSSVAEIRRPRSSMSGTYSAATIAGYGHGHERSSSVAGVLEDFRDIHSTTFPTTPTARRTTLDKTAAGGLTGIPTPSGLHRRQSGGLGGASSIQGFGNMGPARRTSSGLAGDGEMGPPERARKKLSGVGETY